MAQIGIKLATQAMQQTLNQVGREQFSGNLPAGDSSFKQIMGGMDSGEQFAKQIGAIEDFGGLPSQQMNALPADGIEVSNNANVGLQPPDGTQKVVDMLSEVNNGHMKMDQMVNEILYSGKRFSNQELLAIQAQVFHFAQITELVVKAADQGVGSVKAVLNTNIQ